MGAIARIEPGGTTKRRVAEDSQFFDHLVDLIPLRHYLPSQADSVALKYEKVEGGKAEAKRAAKEQSKKAKRLKHPPFTFPSPPLLLPPQQPSAPLRPRALLDPAAAQRTSQALHALFGANSPLSCPPSSLPNYLPQLDPAAAQRTSQALQALLDPAAAQRTSQALQALVGANSPLSPFFPPQITPPQLDPAAAQRTSQALQARQQQQEQGGGRGGAGGFGGGGFGTGGGGGGEGKKGGKGEMDDPMDQLLKEAGVGRKGRAADYQELRARLQQRLEELRKRRNAERASAASEWRKKQRETGAEGDTKGKKGGKERKKGKGGGGGGGEREGAVVGGKRKQQEREGDGGKEGKRERFGKEKGGGKGGRGGLAGAAAGGGGGRAGGRGGEGHGLADDEVIPLDLEFGRVKLGDKAAAGPGMGGGKKGKEGGKVSAKKLLEQAAKIQEKLKGRKLGDKALAEVETHLWNAASSRAAGGKVFDDPNMLSKQQKREQRQKEKSAKLWKERQMTVRKAMKDRQDKRKGNIQERKDNKIAAKIAR
ncbi:unnamed protein product, partial [Closterium sp. Naga37s-1]